MVRKCKKCNKPAVESGYCAEHFGELREKQMLAEKKSIFGSFVGGLKKISPLETLKKVRTKKAEAVASSKPPKEEKKEPDVIKLETPKTPAQQPSVQVEVGKKGGGKEEAKKFESAKEEYEEKIYRKKLDELREKKEKESSFLGKLKGGWGKAKGMPLLGKGALKIEQKIEQAAKRALSPVEAAAWSGIFGLSLVIFMFFTTNYFIPIFEGYSGTPILPSAYYTYLEPVLIDSPIFLPLFIGIVSFPLALVGGMTRWNLKQPTYWMFFLTAIEGSIFLANLVGPPMAETYFPEQYHFFQCMAKYGGNMQICALNQTQQVYVEKVGSYETLTLQMGVSTPSRTIYPMNPDPAHISPERPYFFPFTLKNNNQVGSPYEINVTEGPPTPCCSNGITVAASDGENEAIAPNGGNSIINHPSVPINPGGYFVTQARFEDFGDIVCTDYTHFYINVTTEQHGGGSTKFGIIKDDLDINNQNFMYFFDPDVKTEPGPLDIYTYTLPFVLPLNELEKQENKFQIYITIENKGGGIATIDKLDFHFNPVVFAPTAILDCVPYPGQGVKYDLARIYPSISGGIATFDGLDLNISSGQSFSLVCTGQLKSGDIYGKSTNLISIVTDYTYKQTFEEQISCIVYTMSTGFICPRPGDTDCDTGEKCCCLCYYDATKAGFTDSKGSGGTVGCAGSVCWGMQGGSVDEDCYCPSPVEEVSEGCVGKCIEAGYSDGKCYCPDETIPSGYNATGCGSDYGCSGLCGPRRSQCCFCI